MVATFFDKIEIYAGEFEECLRVHICMNIYIDVCVCVFPMEIKPGNGTSPLCWHMILHILAMRLVL